MCALRVLRKKNISKTAVSGDAQGRCLGCLKPWLARGVRCVVPLGGAGVGPLRLFLGKLEQPVHGVTNNFSISELSLASSERQQIDQQPFDWAAVRTACFDSAKAARALNTALRIGTVSMC